MGRESDPARRVRRLDVTGLNSEKQEGKNPMNH
jgi:hypothetical protein